MNARPDETYSIPVGGLENNKELGISRGRYALKAKKHRRRHDACNS